MKLKKKLFASLLVLSGAVLFAACGSKAADTDTTSASSGEAKKEIVVATSGAPKPFTYVDDRNELVGYDIEVVKAIFEKLPQYAVTFEKTEFTSVLAGLDNGRYQIGANNFAQNKERQEKYIYTDPIFKNQYVIAVRQDENNIKSFADLEGKKTEITPGTNYATAIENYNAQNNGEEVSITYSEDGLRNILQKVEDGAYDFQLIDKAMLAQINEELGLNLKAVELSQADSDRIATPYSYLLVSKTDEGQELADDINGALKEIIADGTVSKISEKYLGGDYAPE